ncbi:MAG: ImmA/IrrE family metallo-endopeptidase [bacterium]
MKVEIKPEMLRWARVRSGLSLDSIAGHFPNIEAWELGVKFPMLKQIEAFARITHVPVGYLFLPTPPVEQLPIPDFRTMPQARFQQPSPDLLEMIYVCQQRQEWYRDYARTAGEKPLPFVGSANDANSVETTAAAMRHALKFDIEERRQLPTWTEALSRFIEQADDLGILVMCSGIVMNNTHRPLDPEEFRGFALTDDLAPLIFINGRDTKATQIFTLAHELAHIWLGQSALSDTQLSQLPDNRIERWCNQVAAELLVPLAVLRAEYQPDEELASEVSRLARRFKVSSLVILRRIYDAGKLTQQQFWQEYQDELQRLCAIPRGSGGNFHLTEAARVSKRFARALVASTFNGITLFRDAFHMLGISKTETLSTFGKSLGVID